MNLGGNLRVCFATQHNSLRKYLSDDSEDSFVSETGGFVPYDESIEPVANEEAEQHAMQVAEEKEEQMLLSRFSGEVDVREWCVGFRCEGFF